MKSFDLNKLINHINKNELVTLLSDLIAIPGHINCSYQEEKISSYVFSIFKNNGIKTTYQKVEPKRRNVIAVMSGKNNGKSLTLNGHLDTVPPNDKITNIKPLVKNGKVFGLGSADMKSGVAAMIYSMILLKRMDVQLDGDLYFTGVIGEESGGTGTAFLMDNGFYSDYFIVGEPTEMKIVNSHKGCFQIDVTIEGKASHASIPQNGANAIEAMAEFIYLLKNEYIPEISLRGQTNVGSPTLNFGVISGGKKINIVADRCLLKIDRRWVDSEKDIDLIAEIEPFLKQVCSKSIYFKYQIEPALPKNRYFGPFYLPETDDFIQICINAFKNIGIKPEISGMPGWTDGATILNKGYPTLILGPGSINVAHTAEEHVDIEELMTAAKIYLSLIYEVCVNK